MARPADRGTLPRTAREACTQRKSNRSRAPTLRDVSVHRSKFLHWLTGSLFLAVITVGRAGGAVLADFSWQFVEGDCASSTYVFTATGDAGVASTWDFGPDATPGTASGESVTVRFMGDPRDQRVRLCTTADCGSQIEKSVRIEIGYRVRIVETRAGASCFGLNVGAVIAGAEPGGAYQYTLSDGSTNRSGVFLNLRPDAYTVTVKPVDTRISCEQKIAATVGREAGLPVAIIQVANAGDPCTRESFRFETDSIAQYGVQYFWNFGLGATPATDTGRGPHVVTYAGVDGPRRVELVTVEAVCRNDTATSVTYEKDIPFIVTTRIQPVGCASPDSGSVAVSVSPVGEYLYTLGDLPDQRVGLFDGVTTGTKLLRVRRIGTPPDCGQTFEVSVGESPIRTPLFLPISVEATSCAAVADGAIRTDPPAGATLLLTPKEGSPRPGLAQLSSGAYTLTLQSAQGCYRDTALSVPAAAGLVVDLGPDLAVEPGDTVLVRSLFTPAVAEPPSFAWSIVGNGFALAESLEALTIGIARGDVVVRLVVTEASGCTAEDQVLIRVLRTPSFQMPTAFSPNGDGVNDVLVPRSRGDVAEVASLDVYDRWGGHVYSAAGLVPNAENTGWGGEYDGRAADAGVYVYVARVLYRDGRSEVFSGGVTLMR